MNSVLTTCREFSVKIIIVYFPLHDVVKNASLVYLIRKFFTYLRLTVSGKFPFSFGFTVSLVMASHSSASRQLLLPVNM